MSACGDKTVKVWTINDGKCAATFQGHNQALVKVAWLNAGLQIASASVDGIVKVWNYKKQQCMNTFEMHDEKIWALDLAERMDEESGVHKLRMITGAGDSRVKVWSDSTVEE